MEGLIVPVVLPGLPLMAISLSPWLAVPPRLFGVRQRALADSVRALPRGTQCPETQETSGLNIHVQEGYFKGKVYLNVLKDYSVAEVSLESVLECERIQ